MSRSITLIPTPKHIAEFPFTLQAVSDVAMQLFMGHLLGTPALEFTESSKRAWHKAHPYAVINSTIMVAIKLLYGLGGDVDEQQQEEDQQQQQQQQILEALADEQPEVPLQRPQQGLGQQQGQQHQQQQEGNRVSGGREAGSASSALWHTWAQTTMARLSHLGFAFLSSTEVSCFGVSLGQLVRVVLTLGGLNRPPPPGH